MTMEEPCDYQVLINGTSYRCVEFKDKNHPVGMVLGKSGLLHSFRAVQIWKIVEASDEITIARAMDQASAETDPASLESSRRQ